MEFKVQCIAEIFISFVSRTRATIPLELIPPPDTIFVYLMSQFCVKISGILFDT